MTALSLELDGKILLTGRCADGLNFRFCAARMHADFTPDLSFDGDSLPGGNGKFLGSTILASDLAYTHAIQPRIEETSNGYFRYGFMVAGACRLGTTTYFCITRLALGERYNAHCHFDLDGDDRNVATIDGLMMTRIMLGLTGSAVTSGITFPVNARRNTWASIRLYLASQCGLSLPL